MSQDSLRKRCAGESPALGSGIAAILLAGVALGLVYNALGLGGEPPRGLTWLAQDKLAQLEKVGPLVQEDAESYESYSTDLDDPLAIPGEVAGVGPALPEIPAVGRPVQVELEVLRAYFDAGAALIVDARDPQDYAAGHIEGAINLPFDEVISNPSLIETLRTGGRPIVTYCGGKGCEVSLGVAEELCAAGHQRVAVYVGGFPEWVGAGNPVGRGGEGER